MFDKEVTEKKEVVLTDSLCNNSATGGGDVHGASSRAEVTINADIVIVAEGVAEVIESIKRAKEFKDGSVAVEEVRGDN